MAGVIRHVGHLSESLMPRPRNQMIHVALKSFSTKASAAAREASLRNLAEKFKKSSEDQKFRHNKSIYTRHVRRLANAKEFALIEDILDHQKRYSDIRHEGFAVRLIGLYGDSAMFSHAHNLFDELPSLGCPRTVKSFNALLKAAVAAKDFAGAVQAFNSLPSSASLEPDIISHNTAIHALCEMGSLDEALSAFHDLGDDKPNLITFNTLFNALYTNNRFAEGETLWAAMDNYGVVPNVRSYNARLRGMFSEGNADEAVRLSGEMVSKGIEADAFTYNAMIRGLCGGGNLEEAKKWYVDLQRSECGPHFVSTYVALVPACCDAGDLDMALELCSDAVKHGLSMKSALFKKVIDSLTGKGRTEDALKLKELIKAAAQ